MKVSKTIWPIYDIDYKNKNLFRKDKKNHAFGWNYQNGL